VSAGDLVVVYTKEGTKREKPIDGGHTAHFFYWNLPQAIWDTKNRAAVLLHAPEWEGKSSDKL
jgi:hypothetical protein